MREILEKAAGIAALGSEPAGAGRRLGAALVAGLLAFVATEAALWLWLGTSTWGFFGSIAAAGAAAMGAATSRIGLSAAFGFLAAFRLLIALAGAAIAVAASCLG